MFGTPFINGSVGPRLFKKDLKSSQGFSLPVEANLGCRLEYLHWMGSRHAGRCAAQFLEYVIN